MSSFVAPIVSCIVGGGLAVATLVGVVTNQTSAPSQSPASVTSPDFNYGSTAE